MREYMHMLKFMKMSCAVKHKVNKDL